ncbi:MAG: cell division protein ZapD [Methylococcales bacterium]|nr:cell division protein ZapD [Methylococcales bacterium]MBT7446078.1 cell division protein ZapD [Methylococcales bacterium]
MPNQVIYELPINERIRTLLRLEQLFARAEHHLSGSTKWDARASVDTLIEILCIGGRADLKSELLKELDRQSNNLSKMAEMPGVDASVLDNVMSDLDHLSKQLFELSGQVGLNLRNTDFIKSIMQRTSIPGGTCDFDLPQYHNWLSQAPEVRNATLQEWFSTFDAVKQASQLILQLIRSSAQPIQLIAENGFYQETLEPSQPAQIIRVTIDTSDMYAEISGGKHRFAIRFLTAHLTDRPTPITDDITFSLTRCII